jgi:hypothetical protein
VSPLRRQWPLFLFFGLACLFLWRVVFIGQVFVPGQLLRHVAPWSASYAPENRPAWNPLMYDSAGQFYPWRKFAAETMKSGSIPLWNPYQFCGTPFVANSQSAALYPGNLLHYLLPTERAVGWSVILHLFLGAAFVWVFLRGLGLSDRAGALGGVAFAFSLWQVAWLHLPTFLATSCWLPLVLHRTRLLFVPPTGAADGVGRPLSARLLRGSAALGFALGMALLAGHLQIAFYILLAAGMLAAGLAVSCTKAPGTGRAARGLASFALALLLAGMLAAPQVLPSLELSRYSHRVGKPTPQGYAAYTDYALHPNALITLFQPDFYGNPSNPSAPYFGASRGGQFFNYAEGALYVGLPTLLLAAYALLRRRQAGRLIPYLGLLALLSLLMALGTAVDALFYFYVPGFGQSGSPGRALALWAFALAALAALGYEKLTDDSATPIRTAALAVGALALLWVAAGLLGMRQVQAIERRTGALDRQTQLPRQAALFVMAAGSVLAMAAGRGRKGRAAALPLLLVTTDLFANGLPYNPTAPREEVYPSTPIIDFLRQNAGHDRVMPINSNWSFAGPQAVLPPNGAMVFGLRDVQGYDSLFPGQYKAFLNRLLGQDASPPEVGNMVFVKRPVRELIEKTGAKWILSLTPPGLPEAQESYVDGIYLYALASAPGRAHARTVDGRPVPVRWEEDRPTRIALTLDSPAPAALTLADQHYPGWQARVNGAPVPMERADIFRRVRVPAGSSRVEFVYRPAAFRVGLYLMLCALAVGVTLFVGQRRGHARSGNSGSTV